jgi:DNA-binding IclR family transcriptional regulator
VLTTVQKIGPVLDLFTVKQPEWGTSEVATSLGTSKSSAHALLTTMAEIGLLERTVHARYRLGWRLLVLGRTVMLSAEYRHPVGKAMQRTVSRWGETMHFAVYDRGCAVYVHKVEGRNSIELATRIGTRLPAHASAVGKMLLAYRDEIPDGPLTRFTSQTIVDHDTLAQELELVRERGLASDDEEGVRGVSCLAGPVWGHDGALIGAISLATSSERLARHRDALARQVGDTCREVSRQLGAIVPDPVAELPEPVVIAA